MKRSLTQLVLVALPKGLGGVLTVVLNGMLLHHMSPAAFGVYMLAITWVLVADGVIGGALDMASMKLASVRVSQGASAGDALAVEHWCLALKGLLCTALAGVAAAGGLWLSAALFDSPQASLPLLVVALLAATLLLRSLSLHLQLRARFGRYAALELLLQSARVGAILLVIWWWQPSPALLLGLSAALMGLAFVLGLAIAGMPLWPARLPRSDGRALWQTLAPMLMVLAVSSVLARLDVLALGQLSTMEQVGLFSAALVFAQIPELLGTYLAVVVSPKVAPAAQAGRLLALMQAVQRPLGAGVLALALACAAGSATTDLWLPPAYAASATVFVPLLLGTLAGMMVLPLIVPYVLFMRPRLILLFDVLTLPLLLLAYFWAIRDAGALGAAWVSAGTRVLKSIVLWAFASNWARQHTPLPATP